MSIARIIVFSLTTICMVASQQTNVADEHEEVKYTGPPSVSNIGDTIVIECRVTHFVPVNWIKDNKSLDYYPSLNFKKEKDTLDPTYIVERLILLNATPEYTGEYACTKMYAKGYRVSVFADIMTNEEVQGTGIILTRGQKAEIQCNVTSDPKAQFAWYKNGVQIALTDGETNILIHHENNTLVIKKGSDADAGAYMCAIENNRSKNKTIVLRTMVKVEPYKKESLSFVEGDRLKLTCKVEGNPMPVITWTKDGENVADLNTTRIALKPDEKNFTNAILEIEVAEDGDKGHYSCLAQNDISNATFTVQVRIKDKLAALWPFLGIVAEVIVLCGIIFIYERRRAKQEFEESDTDQSPESKPVADHKEKDVRQRK